MEDTTFRTIVYCDDTLNEVVAEVTIAGPTMDVLHLHENEPQDDVDAVEAFRAKFYEAQVNIIVD